MSLTAQQATVGRSPVANLGATCLTVTAAAGMGRLFGDTRFLGPVVVTALTMHGVALLCRHRRLGTPLAALVSGGVLALLTGWLILPDTLAYGLPTGATLDAAGRALQDAGRAFAEVIAPAPSLTGFLLAAVLATGVCAFMTDWAAFRLAMPFEACIPSFTLFVFTAALSAGRFRSLAVAAYAGSVLAFLLAHNVARQQPATWFGGRPGRGPLAMANRGATLGVVAVTAGLAFGPQLPGAGNPPVIAYRNTDGPGRSARTVVSPLVDIRGRLIEHAGVEVFTVRSPEPRYWRLTSLDVFDGNIWSSNDTYEPTGGQLEVAGPFPPSTHLRQEFSISSLASTWLPAAFRPVRLSGVDDASQNADAASLISDQETSDGLTYRVLSAIPQFDAAALTAMSNRAVPRRVADRYLGGHEPSAEVVALARRVTERGRGPYEQAKLLQDFFRTRFKYDQKVPQGHDNRALERFLFRTQRGYCEQFAGAYAVMARAIGVPARVAVGFTQGELGADGVWHVRDEHAHAWPEVWINGAGWVYFEPTPGRGAPGAQAYTGAPVAQAATGRGGTATTASQTPPTAPGQQATSTTAANAQPAQRDLPDAGQRDSSPSRRPLIAAAVVIVAALAWVVVVPALHRRRRRRRRESATTPGDRVLVAWEEAHEALARSGLGRRPAETFHEHARRASRSLDGEARAAITDLGRDATIATYATIEVGDEVAERAAKAVAAVERCVSEAATPPRRLAWALDPRPLFIRQQPLAPRHTGQKAA